MLTGIVFDNCRIVEHIIASYKGVLNYNAPTYEDSGRYKNVLFINFKSRKEQKKGLRKTFTLHGKTSKSVIPDNADK